jgi:purine catabolism regulator
MTGIVGCAPLHHKRRYAALVGAALDILSPSAPLTVRAALRLPELAEGRPVVVGGREGLDRPIRWAHVAEVRDVARLLRGGELLLTTGVALPPGAAGRRAWFGTLVERGVAAVVLELGEHVRDLPAHLARVADAHALPLVALRDEVRFVAVTEVVHARLLDAQHALLRRGAELDRRLADVAAEGGDAGAVVDALVATTGAAVWLCDDGGRVLHGRAAEGPVAEAPLARAGRRLRLAARDHPVTDFDRLALERGAALLDLLLLRAHHERRLEVRRAGATLDRLREGDPAAVAEVARRLGPAAAAGPLVPVALRVPGGAEDALPDVAGALGPALPGAALVGVHGDEVLLVAAGADRGAVGARVAGAAERAAARRPGGVAVVAVGARAPSVAAAGPLLLEAAEAAALTDAGDATVVVDVAAPDLERLLAGLRCEPRAARFSARLLAPVDAHDDRAPAAALRPTLAALCRAAGNRRAAAAALGVHRQTLYRRIDRLEELTDLDLGSADGLLAATLALRCAPVAAGE